MYLSMDSNAAKLHARSPPSCRCRRGDVRKDGTQCSLDCRTELRAPFRPRAVRLRRRRDRRAEGGGAVVGAAGGESSQARRLIQYPE